MAEEFMKKEFGGNSLALALRDQQVVVRNKENDKDNPITPTPSGRNDKSETIQVNLPSNSPQPNHGQDESSAKNKDNKTLIIDLKNAKKITLTPEGNLVIEFDDKQGNNYTYPEQIITPDLINNSQELQTIKNYCQQSGKSSLSRSDLNNIFSTNDANIEPTGKPADNNYTLAIGLSIITALIFGLTIGLLLKRKKVIKRI
jgi:hypothetical protein